MVKNTRNNLEKEEKELERLKREIAKKERELKIRRKEIEEEVKAIEERKKKLKEKESKSTALASEKTYASKYAFYDYERDTNIDVDDPVAAQKLMGVFVRIANTINTSKGIVEIRKIGGGELEPRNKQAGQIALEVNGRTFIGKKQTLLNNYSLRIASENLIGLIRRSSQRKITRADRFYEGEAGTDIKIQDAGIPARRGKKKYIITKVCIKVLGRRLGRYTRKTPLTDHIITNRGR